MLGFVHYLRAHEFDVNVQDAALIGSALAALPHPDLELSRNACRAICCRRRDHWEHFDTLFDAYWFGRRSAAPGRPADPDKAVSLGGGLAGIGTAADPFNAYTRDAAIGGGAGRQTTIAKADFRFLGDRDAMRRVEELAERLARQLQVRPGRRRTLNRRRGRLAVRPTLRGSVRFGGVPLTPWYSKRRTELPRLVILHDVSHSMTFNNPLLFRFTRGLVRRFDTAEAYVFHTRLFRVTPMYREASIHRMRELLERNNRLWLGGTCIADSLAQFRDQFAYTLKSESLVVIISDGFDSNEPDRLAAELKALRARCRRVVWLNPMLERAGFNPDKEAVWNVRRNVDRLLPAHSLDALRRCIGAITA